MLRPFLLAAALPPVSHARPLPPSLEALTSDWQPIGPIYGTPTVSTAWGSLLVSASNVFGINNLAVPPFSSGWNAPTDTATLSLNGLAVNSTSWQWSPMGVKRAATTGQFTLTTEVRMVFEGQGVLLEAVLALAPGEGAGNASIDVDFFLPLRNYPKSDECTSWHYPTHSVPCCWNWFPPEPNFPGDGGAFSSTWGPGLTTLVGADAASASWTAFAFPPAGGSVLGAPQRGTGTVGSWDVRLPSPSSSVVLRAALVFTNSTSGDASAAAAALASAFDTAWADAANDMQARFDAMFEGGFFSGSLPTLDLGGGGGGAPAPTVLETPAGSQQQQQQHGQRRRVGQGCAALEPMEKAYYLGVAGALQTSHTNLPPPSAPPSAACNAGNAGTATATAASQHSPSGLDRYLGSPRVATLGGSAFSGRRTFSTGSGMNSTTNFFYWETSYAPTSYVLLDPQWQVESLVAWVSSIEQGVPSYWSYWGFDDASGRGIGNFYSANDFTLSQTIHTLLAVSRSTSVLGTPVANGTATLYDVLLAMATHWRSLNPSGFLADYGLAPNLLECVPTYIHYVASCNAANAWMMRRLAGIVGGDPASPYHNASLAKELLGDAKGVSQDVLSRLYFPGQGYFGALYPNGTLQQVRHIMDYVYVSYFLGGDIPPTVAGEMTDFVARELLTPGWMRALSPLDPAAPFSNRSDHGPSGAYIGWPPLTMQAYGGQGRYTQALAFLNDTVAAVASLGPFGQAVEVRPPGTPYKPFDVTLYVEITGLSFAEVVLGTFFGYTGGQGPSPLGDEGTPRGFSGVLWGVRWGNETIDIVSGEAGLTWRWSSSGGGE
jgi:hypothetical protein